MVYKTFADSIKCDAYHVITWLAKSNVGRHCLYVSMSSVSVGLHKRVPDRGIFNVVGCLIFMVLYTVLPKTMYPYIGMIGGIGVGYSAGYAWQTVFNTFGALSIASGIFGMPMALKLRIGANVLGAVYTVVCTKVFNFLANLTNVRKNVSASAGEI